MYDYIEVHFGEIWLRGKNRSKFIGMLISNIEYALRDEHYSKIANMRDRILILLNEDSNIDSMLSCLGYVFGISWYAPSVIAKNTLADIKRKAEGIAVQSNLNELRIIAHRSTKNTRFDSKNIVGMFLEKARLQKLLFIPNKEARDVLYISVTGYGTLIHVNKIKGIGGLPVGSSGRAIVLISGGIDSPVAAYMAMKRGLEPVYLHVHALPSNKEAMSSKIPSLIDILGRYSKSKRIYYMPSHIFQSYLLKLGRHYGKYETVLFKRFLFKAAEQIAAKENINSVVTGESIGQVSSQTTYNMYASSNGIKLFVIRPLIALDKEEIINIAKKVGTFEISIKKYRDVCSINSHNPKTKVAAEKIAEMYEQARLSEALEQTLKKTEPIDL
ncbi:MAG: tRNA uracil 4-sulfurtransferase ThiI [Candidatus Micrarchaeia archaeon]